LPPFITRHSDLCGPALFLEVLHPLTETSAQGDAGRKGNFVVSFGHDFLLLAQKLLETGSALVSLVLI